MAESTRPGDLTQPDPEIAVADARAANDFLAAVPTQDPHQAAAELRRAVQELGLCGALVNDHNPDEPQYAPFWEALQDLCVVLYIRLDLDPGSSS